MSLYEPRTRAELSAHYSAVRARLLAPRPVLPKPVVESYFIATPPPKPTAAPEEYDASSVEGVAAKWRELDKRLFGGRVSPKSVIYVTAAYFNVDAKTFVGNQRTKAAVRPRHAAMYIMRKLCRTYYCGVWSPMTWNKIAVHFTQSHETAFHAADIVVKKLQKDEKYAAAIAEIMTLLQLGAATE